LTLLDGKSQIETNLLKNNTFESLASYAKRHGVTKQTVSLWNKRGWIVLEGAKVDAEASNARVRKYRDTYSPNARRGKPTVFPGITPEWRYPGSCRRPDRVQWCEYALWRGAPDAADYEAKLLELEYDLKTGFLVPIGPVGEKVGKAYARLRTRLLAPPSERAPQLHRLKTVEEVHAVMQDIIHWGAGRINDRWTVNYPQKRFSGCSLQITLH